MIVDMQYCLNISAFLNSNISKNKNKKIKIFKGS